MIRILAVPCWAPAVYPNVSLPLTRPSPVGLKPTFPLQRFGKLIVPQVFFWIENGTGALKFVSVPGTLVQVNVTLIELVEPNRGSGNSAEPGLKANGSGGGVPPVPLSGMESVPCSAPTV